MSDDKSVVVYSDKTKKEKKIDDYKSLIDVFKHDKKKFNVDWTQLNRRESIFRS